MIQEHDIVIVKEDMPALGLHSGDRGTVIFIPKTHEGFMVEFDKGEDEPILATLYPDQISPADTKVKVG